MKRMIFFAALLIATTAAAQTQPISSVRGELEKLPGVSEVKPLRCDTFFLEKYLVRVNQAVDHNKKNGREFSQRVFVGFRGRTRPTVFVTEGYTANYAAWPKYVEELCLLLDANLVFVEHRYFGESIPDTANWKYLTIQQAAADHHHINRLMRNIFSGKFVSTGVSKGGQTTMYYKYYYPGDATVWVPYVGPLNFSVTDKRVNPFINRTGSQSCRDRIRDFQMTALKRQDKLMDGFNKAAQKEGYHFETTGGQRAAYEYMVLEYPFAFWQWGNLSCDDIPAASAADSTVLKHLLAVSPPDYFADEGIRSMWPFFYQALTQIGYYGYDTTGMGKYMQDVPDLSFGFMAPEGPHPHFKKKYMRRVSKYLKNHGNNMIFIYGENDPWSSTGFVPDNTRTNALRVVKPGGSHTSRIRNLPKQQQQQVLDSLQKWMAMPLNRDLPWVK